MIEIENKAFNEIFLSEISKFDSGKYAYNTFFDCDKERFSKIAKQYGIRSGSGALSYMYNNFYSWKNGSVNPNINTQTKIISSTISTFTTEEKFIEAYTKLAKDIKYRFPQKIELKDVNKTFELIVEAIKEFNLEETYTFSHNVFKKEEIQDYQEYVKIIFLFYTKTIFENLNKDLPLIIKAHQNINTAFLTVTFNTYLFNIEIKLQGISKQLYSKKIFEFEHTLSYEELLNNKFSNFSLEKISEIAKANNIIEIDAFLTEIEIQKIVSQKKEIQNSKNGGTLKYTFKTNSGILIINLRILSFAEKLIVFFRIISFLSVITGLFYYCFILTQSYFIFAMGLIASSSIVTTIHMDILNLLKDILKPKQNG